MVCKVDENHEECPSPSSTYMAIVLYVMCKFASDVLNYLRELPFAEVSAKAEVSICHDVYEHVNK